MSGDGRTAEEMEVRAMTLRPVQAHQSGDGVQICHCPFCGSGQVIGRSDGNSECSFCNQAFLVRVQPMYSAFPQSVNGMPVDIPGMPPAAGMPGMDPAAGGMPPGAEGEMPPGEDGEDEGAPPFGQDSGGDEATDDGGDDGDGKDSGGDGADDKPPFGKKSYRTASGQRMGRAAYVTYLAAHIREGR
jgi:hypothetical protein